MRQWFPRTRAPRQATRSPAFYAKELSRTGDRSGALDLQFADLMEHLSPKSYESFRKKCSPEEWARYEPNFLAALKDQRTETRISIHMVRGEHVEAVRLLADVRFDGWRSDSVLKAATRLEAQFPREVLDFYRSGLGRTDRTAPRGEYAQWARIVAKMRHVWVDVMHEPDAWAAFAQTLKAQSQRRPG